MADQADVQKVLDNIDAEYESNGWSTETIVGRLDDGAVPERVIALYWRSRASATIALVNVSESGSSRGMDSVYPRMKELAEYWEGIADGVENPPAVETRGRIGSFAIKRV